MLRHDDNKAGSRRFPLKNMMSYASVAAVFLFVLFGWMFQVRIPDSRIPGYPSISDNGQDRL